MPLRHDDHVVEIEALDLDFHAGSIDCGLALLRGQLIKFVQFLRWQEDP